MYLFFYKPAKIQKTKQFLDKMLEKISEIIKSRITKALPVNAIWPQAVLIFDALIAFLALFIALYLRVGDEFLDYTPSFILKNMMVFSFLSLSVFLWMQTHKVIWRYMALEDIVPLALSAFMANVLFFPLMILLGQQESLPKSLPVITALVLIILLCLPRFIYRIIHEYHAKKKRQEMGAVNIPVLLVGHDDATDLFIREVHHNHHLPYKPIGIITPDEAEKGRFIHDVPILGTMTDAPKILQKLINKNMAPNIIMITEETIESSHKRIITNMAKSHGLTIMHVLHHFSLNPVDNEDIPEEDTSRL